MRVKQGLIYAGGRGLRMGGVDKSAILLGGRPLYQWVVDRMTPMCEQLAVVAPQRPEWLEADSAIEHVFDETIEGEPIGPAGALLAGLKLLNREDEAGWLITAAVDAPFFPGDLVERLFAGRGDAPAVIARSEDGLHPTFGLWNADCYVPVKTAIESGRMYALRKLVSEVGGAQVSVAGPDQQFLNINTPDELDRARSMVDVFGSA